MVDHFQAKSPLTNFQTLTHQISIFADFTHFEQPFLLKTQKQPILRYLSIFLMYFKFHPNCYAEALIGTLPLCEKKQMPKFVNPK